jgi:hypothetical protein
VSTSTLHAPQDMSHYSGDEITKVRIYRLEDAPFGTPAEVSALTDDAPWQIDGYDERTGRVTQDVLNYVTHAGAVRGIPEFLEWHGYTLVSIDEPIKEDEYA